MVFETKWCCAVLKCWLGKLWEENETCSLGDQVGNDGFLILHT